MSLTAYIPRVIDRQLQDMLEIMGGVVIEGPRACGKTETARHIAKSELLLDIDSNARETIALQPELVLQGSVPRLIDEWQTVPEIWNLVRREIDQRRESGQFILTGSAVPSHDITRHSGAGRMARLKMRPMSLLETGHSSGMISLSGMIEEHKFEYQRSEWNLKALITTIARGGWPSLVEKDDRIALEAVKSYIEETKRTDLTGPGIKGHRPETIGRCLRSLARNVATTATLKTIAADAGGSEGPLNYRTVESCLTTLRQILVTEDQEAWMPSLRSRSRLRGAVKRHFVCPSLAVAALGVTPGKLLSDLKYVGFLFESLVVRDLRIYAGDMGTRVLHYKDSTDLEVDAIVENGSGQWAAFEIKLSPQWSDEAAKNLLRFRDRVEGGEAGFLGVIVPWGYSYMRKDGVAVIALNALGP